ncbi:phage tail protein [Photorhabdus sp. CRCIA-P01]|uniref:phage tail protein n=1 Tax=Photorhabdus sp. CRCIA-P01 TaxID=2019570 RepID=UPI001E333B79|nr:phage tail protein [Photorhabdus sp. CRCIA-P01]
MNHKNDFKAFSINNNANVVSQEKYEENQSLKTGFPPDDITVHLLNKVLRQSSTIASVVSNFIATYSGNDVLDDGDIVKLAAQLNRALEQKIATEVPNASLTQKGVVQLTEVVGNGNTLAATQKLVSDVNNNANSRLSKNQNGADVPNKNEFVKNLGLSETVKLAQSAYPKSGGVVNGNVDATGYVSGKGVYEAPGIRVYSSINKPSPGELGAYTTGDCDRRFQLKGNYALAGQSYTKSESDSRYLQKNTGVLRTQETVIWSGWAGVDATINTSSDILGRLVYMRFGEWSQKGWYFPVPIPVAIGRIAVFTLMGDNWLTIRTTGTRSFVIVATPIYWDQVIISE